MTTLGSDFEEQLREAVLDDAEQSLIGEDGLVQQAVEQAHERLRAYGREHEYDIEPIIDSFAGPEVERDDGQLTVRWGWRHEASVYMEFGTSDHTIEGDPVLSFIWGKEDAPDWVAREFEPEGDGYRVFLPEVEVSGLPESRYVRDALNWLRREVQR